MGGTVEIEGRGGAEEGSEGMRSTRAGGSERKGTAGASVRGRQRGEGGLVR